MTEKAMAHSRFGPTTFGRIFGLLLAPLALSGG